ncbi:MAG: YaaA family protein, partial [Rickettsiales bacterium]
FEYASENLRILSGLYGILKPFDQIQPYRLEMGTKLANEKGKNLYDFWQATLTQKVNQAKGNVIINLASQEYFKVLNHKQLNKNIITPLFYDYKNGQYKAIMMYAKKARGMMARYIIKNKITQWEQIKFFNYENYIFNEELSNFDCKNKKIVFTRS